MSLRAVVVAWPGHALGRTQRTTLASLLEGCLASYPGDAEVPTSDQPVPASTVALEVTSIEPAYSPLPWPQSPLSSASHVVCFEGHDSDDLALLAQRWQQAGSKMPGLEVHPLEVRDRLYTSATIATVAYDQALGRHSRQEHPYVLLWSFQRVPRWWELSPLQRQALFLPRLDEDGRVVAPGHVEVSAPLVSTVHRRLYHEPVPRESCGLMLGWFETSEEHLATLRQVAADLQDISLAPDHAYYRCGPLIWGQRRDVMSLVTEIKVAA